MFDSFTTPPIRPGRFAGLAGELAGRDEERPPLVLLHGLTFDRRSWRPALAELERIDPERRVLSLDLPGHGDSAARDRYPLDDVAGEVHAAVRAAGLEAPVVVGHSIAAVIATIYATRYPATGVVNVDQALDVEPFAGLVHSLADRLRGPEFDALFAGLFLPSMGVELLPPAAQELVRAMSRPEQALVLGYWGDLLAASPAALGVRAAGICARIAAGGLPYLLVAGREPDARSRAWLRSAVPQASIDVFAGSGHFPQLADPARFARVLAATGVQAEASATMART